MWGFLAGVAAAQSMPPVGAHAFRPAIDAEAFVAVDDASRRPIGYTSGRVWVNGYAGAVRAVGPDGDTVALVDRVLAADLVGALHFEAVRVGVHLPTFGALTSDLGAVGAGIGDLTGELKVSFLDPAAAGWGVAFLARGSLPTARSPSAEVEVPMGWAGPTGELSVAAQAQSGAATLALNLGWRALPRVSAWNLDTDDALTVRVGVGVPIGEVGGWSVEVFGQRDLASGSLPGSPFEGLASGWVRLGEGAKLHLSLGAGLTDGVGAPAARALVGVSGAVGPRSGAPAQPDAPAP